MRPTIQDLAKAAGVSRATVNRVIGEPSKVRAATRQLVIEAAAEIGYRGLPALAKGPVARPFRLALVMQQPSPWFCDQMADAIHRARDEVVNRQVRLRVERIADLAPEVLADWLTSQGRQADAIAIVAPEHPIIARAIEGLAEAGVPSYALVTTLSAPSLAGYVGLDPWRVGRTAAWSLDRLLGRRGTLGILLGLPRYREHQLAESGFRSYFRERDHAVRLLEPLPTFESDGIAREMTERLLQEHPDLTGVFLSGGGTAGMVSALQESGRAQDISTVAYDLTDENRLALLNNALDLVIVHPFHEIGRAALGMILSDEGKAIYGGSTRHLPFSLLTPESV